MRQSLGDESERARVSRVLLWMKSSRSTGSYFKIAFLGLALLGFKAPVFARDVKAGRQQRLVFSASPGLKVAPRLLISLSPDGKKRNAIKNQFLAEDWDITDDGRGLVFTGQPSDVDFFSAGATRYYLWAQNINASRSAILHSAYDSVARDQLSAANPVWNRDGKTFTVSMGSFSDYGRKAFNVEFYDLSKRAFYHPHIPKLAGAIAKLNASYIDGALSPDKKHLLFVARSAEQIGSEGYNSLGFNRKSNLVLQDFSTGKFRVLRTEPKSDMISHPRWSTDGRAWAWSENGAIWKSGFKGAPQKLTDKKMRCFTPAWSPDGKRLAFLSEVTGKSGIYQVWVMNADGSQPHRIASDLAAAEQNLRWLAVAPETRFRKVSLDFKARPDAKTK